MHRRPLAVFLTILCLAAGLASQAAAQTKNCLTDVDCGAGGKCDTTSHTCAAAPAAGGAPAGSSANCPPNTPPGTICLTNPINVKTVPELVNNILKTVIGIVGALSLLIFIYGGLRWLTSAGEPAKIQAGKDAMKWAAIGLVVIFSSYALVSFVFKAFTG